MTKSGTADRPPVLKELVTLPPSVTAVVRTSANEALNAGVDYPELLSNKTPSL
jgi:hypothetical protein